METRKYEITYIIRPDLEESAKAELVARFDKILADNGATVVDSKDWDTRRFAYPIAKYTEGTYHVVNVEADSDEALNEFSRLAKFSDDILRHMIVKR
ncbi:30S ribosomal protein S6 [Limosilactobacillus ingluviei]|mgnify:FL=1|uniref:Small ribosomal subunit protein bS6 n=2 Tax=Limosilactobacillus ingluviei TaxID=148604 RepID=A0A0R2GXQ2_9LACO|nr:30S ribosomal protein S6 [Limosilactobacillus ingluviei]KRL91739.1 ribosomal protein S6 [Limosilactobacillus ingluviei DSM 15946]KRN45553.1 ribosomal protein S6 [Limosilactobacillus ingluviei]MBM6727695.1 30S ribosomal protein S6 [Limosilactobacillus ingluviei]MDO4603448.1 30S ribosomal protein S6 [Limosilactobacillus ingluviei]HJG49991.1 30S ribosomal protein S6 [Limosilactobacillus ingluviei]